MRYLTVPNNLPKLCIGDIRDFPGEQIPEYHTGEPGSGVRLYRCL